MVVGGSGGMLPQKNFENLLIVVVISIPIPYFFNNSCANFGP